MFMCVGCGCVCVRVEGTGRVHGFSMLVLPEIEYQYHLCHELKVHTCMALSEISMASIGYLSFFASMEFSFFFNFYFFCINRILS